MVKAAINGFGRIGRLTFRFAWDMMPDLEIVHVNEITGGAETAAYLVKYDSVHGIWSKEVEKTSEGAFSVDGKTVTFSDHKDFTSVDWKGLGVEIVIDCTGKFLTVEKLRPYLDVCGVKRVVVSAPVKEPSVLNVVVGVNDDKLNDSHVICTAASCTTNCIAPIIKVRPPSAALSPLPLRWACRPPRAIPSAIPGDPREAHHRKGNDHDCA